MFKLVNVRTADKSPSQLRVGEIYEAKFDKNGDLRVKDDSGKMSKYGLSGWAFFRDAKHDSLSARDAYCISEAFTSAYLTAFKSAVTNSEEELDRIDDTLWDAMPVSARRTPPDLYAEHYGHAHVMNTASATPVPSAPVATPVTAPSSVTIKPMEASTMNTTTTTTPVETATPSAPKMTLKSFLTEQGVPLPVIAKLLEFRKAHGIDDSVKSRVEIPHTLYQGGVIWTKAIVAILNGNNILLQGVKATGKNVLASGLAFLFGRPLWDISFHVNMDAGSLIGAETFKNNEVTFRPGAVYECAMYGGFGVLDEINMAKNEAVAVLHSITDDRRVIDVPGYERLKLNPATRFIATMNYGYAGTRELNEALASRFVVIHMPQMTKDELVKLFAMKYPEAKKDKLGFFAQSFLDLERKAENSEISTKPVDLRGYLDALGLMQLGTNPYDALEMCVINKAFDKFEREIISDTLKTTIPKEWLSDVVFANSSTVTKNNVPVNFGGK